MEGRLVPIKTNIRDEEDCLCNDCDSEPRIKENFRKTVQFSDIKRSCSSSGSIGDLSKLSSGLKVCMALRSQSTPVQSHMNAEDDYIISLRSSQIRMQKHANSPFLPPPGKFAKASSLPNLPRRPRSAEYTKHCISSPVPCFTELSTSIQVSDASYCLIKCQ